MGTHIEIFTMTPDGEMHDRGNSPKVLPKGGIELIENAFIDGRECCVQITNEGDETVFSIHDNTPEIVEFSLSFPGISEDVFFIEDFELNPSRFARVTHTA